MDGQVRNVNERGYAFVRGENGKDYFLHATHLVGSAFQELRPHDTVSFQPAHGPPGKGPIATNAERVTRAVENGARRLDRWHMLADVPADGYEGDDTTEYDWGAAS